MKITECTVVTYSYWVGFYVPLQFYGEFNSNDTDYSCHIKV